MNTTVNTDQPNETPQKTGLRPEALQAIELIGEAFAGEPPEANIEVTPTSVSFPVLYGRCTISASPLNIDTYDGLRLSEQLVARTDLVYVINDMEDDFLALANEYATTGAALRCPDTGTAVLVSRVSVFEDDTEALLNYYAPSLYWSSLVQSFSIQQAMRRQFGTDWLGEKSQLIGTPGCDAPSRWDAGQFTDAEQRLRERGVYCNAGEAGLTAEFPWDPGAVSSMTGHQTSLFQANGAVAHPTAGNGLAFRLILPTAGGEYELAPLATKLNLLEADAIDMPPGFGAWSYVRHFQALGYTGFWPNCMYRPGVLFTIASYCLARSRFAQLAIANAC
jgi:hypothetical protein